jgi:beta-glucanase (GH16 family)
MKPGTAVCVLVAVSIVTPVNPSGQAPGRPAAPEGWRLVWQDEFDGARLSPEKWNVLLREDSKHGELQYYLPDEAYVEHGCLRLRSRVREFGAKHYTSGRVDTSGKFAPTYGRFEIRARLPVGQGLWPAHWLYPQDRDWAMEMRMLDAVASGREALIPEHRPWYTEIDIMEFLGHEPKTVYGTFHYYTFDGRKQASSGTFKGDVDFTTDFHVFVLEWEPDSLRWFVDGRPIHSTATRVPHTPHYLILNTAIGGAWPGNPDRTTVFPQYHDIDYVRVYQKPAYFAR